MKVLVSTKNHFQVVDGDPDPLRFIKLYSVRVYMCMEIVYKVLEDV